MTNEQAIEVINGHIKDSSIAYGTFTGQALHMAIEALKATDIEHLPPAQPEQRTGYFIGTEFDGYADGSPVYYEWECSECGCVFEDDEPTYNYCPNCGAKMVEK